MDLGVSFLSFADPLRRDTDPSTATTFGYLVPSPVLLSDSETSNQREAVDRLVQVGPRTPLSAPAGLAVLTHYHGAQTLCQSELPAKRVTSVSRELALPSAILTSLVAGKGVSGYPTNARAGCIQILRTVSALVVVAALEAADWSFAKLMGGEGIAELQAAAEEAVAIGTARHRRGRCSSAAVAVGGWVIHRTDPLCSSCSAVDVWATQMMYAADMPKCGPHITHAVRMTCRSYRRRVVDQVLRDKGAAGLALHLARGPRLSETRITICHRGVLGCPLHQGRCANTGAWLCVNHGSHTRELVSVCITAAHDLGCRYLWRGT